MTQQITAQLLKGGLTVDASGNVTATGRFSGPTQKTGTIKAQDGTTAITIADSTGKVTLAGDLIVSGTTTTINSTTLTVDDKNIEIGSVATPTDLTANGGGITLKGASDKTILWTNSTDTWDFNQGITTSGIVTATGGTSSNWNTAYGWGDHSGAGYATSGGAITVSTINGTEIVAGTNGNLGVGITTLDSLTSGHNNVGAGDNALTSCTDGYQNTAIGSYAMENTTSANQNAAAGFCALRLNETGERNTAMGAKALRSLATGDFNTAVGYYALYLTNGANWNTALGFDAGKSIVGGNNNTILGAKAGDNITSGSSNIIIGYNIDADSATGSNQLNIGNTIYGNLSTGNIGIGTASPSGSLWDENANVLHIYKNSVNGGLLKLESSNTKGFLHAGNDNVYLGSITSDPVGIFTNSIRRMTIDSSGHVGIGATSLDHALQVKTPGSGGDFLRFETDGSHGCKPKIQFDSGLGGTNYAAKSTIQGGYDSGQGGSGGYLAFSTKNTSETLLTRMTIDSSGNVLPGANDSYSLGSTSLRWQNIWTNDLHLVNERGDWTVIEEEDYLTLRNNKTNKMFKIVMEEL